jgi:anamorsin
MAPSIALDTYSDFTMPTKSAAQPLKRTLLLSPPSLSSHEEKLNNVLEMHNRKATDMQMLDRLSLGLVSLPESTYDVIIILSDADGTRRESQNLLSRKVLALLVKTLRAGGLLRSQDGQFGNTAGQEKNEAILAGLSFEPGKGFVKSYNNAQESVPLRLGKRSAVANAAGGVNGANGGSVSLPLNGKRGSQDMGHGLPSGVGFDDGTDSAGQPEEDSDDELIDEDTLLDEEDLKRTIKIRE